MAVQVSKLQERLAWIHRMLIAPPEKSNLNHFQKIMLEEEYEEIELQAKEIQERVGS